MTEQKTDAQKKRYTKEHCKYVFSEKEMKEIAGKMAMKRQEKEETEIEKKATMSSYKERLEGIDLELKSCSTRYKDGYEMRFIECEIVTDWDKGIVSYVRTDTGECVRTKDITNQERQLHFEHLEKLKKEGTASSGEKDSSSDVEEQEIGELQEA